MAESVASVRDLRKEYGGTTAVDGISFEVGRHEIVGLLGPNGAGKTTTISMLLGVLAPTSGRITIEGIDLAARGMRAIVAGGNASSTALLAGAGLAVLDILLACWIFVRVYRHAVRTGLIARYAAESLS